DKARMALVPPRASSPGRRTRDRNWELTAFLPTCREEMLARGWDELDVLIVTGDAYVDHPAFGPVLVARFLAGRGLRVGIVAQPKWRSPDDIAGMGRPRLFEPLPPGVPGAAAGHRRNRGVAPEDRALRLLERHGSPLDPPRQQGRSPRVRNGRARGLGDRPPPRRGRGPRRARHGARHGARPQDPSGRGTRGRPREPVRDRRQAGSLALLRGG